MIHRFNVDFYFHLNNDQHIYNQIWTMLKLKALGDAQEPIRFCSQASVFTRCGALYVCGCETSQ